METEERAIALELALWRRLVAAGLRAGARYEDAQDLSSQAILRALEAHDPARGAFEPFCRAIHANLLKNHWRDRRPTREFDPEMDGGVDGFDPQVWLVILEDREMLRDISDRILAALEPEEAVFFLALAEAYRETERAAVTAVARRLGHEPLRGWDIFRRIQRKARRHLQDYLHTVEPQRDLEACRSGFADAEAPPPDFAASPASDEIAAADAFRSRREVFDREPPAEPDFASRLASVPEHRPNPLLMLASLCATAGHERFAAALTAEQRSRLAALLS
jgi:hypothetical protein